MAHRIATLLVLFTLTACGGPGFEAAPGAGRDAGSAPEAPAPTSTAPEATSTTTAPDGGAEPEGAPTPKPDAGSGEPDEADDGLEWGCTFNEEYSGCVCRRMPEAACRVEDRCGFVDSCNQGYILCCYSTGDECVCGDCQTPMPAGVTTVESCPPASGE